MHLAYLLLPSQLAAVKRLPELMEELDVHCAVVSTMDYIASPRRRIFARAEYGRPAGELAGLWRTRGFRDFRAALAGPWPDLPCAGCSKRFEKIW